MIKSKKAIYVLLYTNFLMYSLVYVLAKFAGNYKLISLTAAVLYSVCLFILGVYAILWQQILKRLPLTVAYTNKAVTVLFGMLWGYLIFGEQIKLNMLLGAAIIVCGIVVLVYRNE